MRYKTTTIDGGDGHNRINNILSAGNVYGAVVISLDKFFDAFDRKIVNLPSTKICV